MSVFVCKSEISGDTAIRLKDVITFGISQQSDGGWSFIVNLVEDNAVRLGCISKKQAQEFFDELVKKMQEFKP